MVFLRFSSDSRVQIIGIFKVAYTVEKIPFKCVLKHLKLKDV